MIITLLALAILEISLSFDNAVVNAKVLGKMPRLLQTLFLTLGWLIAVVAVRLYLPIYIVAWGTGLSASAVTDLALHDPNQYAGKLLAAHSTITAFGATFLFLVFSAFLFEDGKEKHWFPGLEPFCNLLSLFFGELLCLLAVSYFLLMFGVVSNAPLFPIVLAFGVFILLRLCGELMESNANRIHSAVLAFLYLEILDASFSLDGVVAAFSLSDNIYLIAAGLGLGAWAIRYLTVRLVRSNTLQELPYLEHGAHWAIGWLSTTMLLSNYIVVDNWIVALGTVAIIAVSVHSSLKERGVSMFNP